MKDDRKYWREETRMNDYKWLWFNRHGKLGRRGWIRVDPAEGEVLLRYCKLAKEGIVEIGRKFGGSTCLMMAESTVPVISIDIFDHIGKNGAPKENPCVSRVRKHINEGRLTLITAKSAEVELTNEYDVLFVDGNHSYSGVVADIRTYWKKLTGYALFHDYWISTGPDNKKPGVTRAVDELLLDTECGEVVDHVGEMLVVKKVKEL